MADSDPFLHSKIKVYNPKIVSTVEDALVALQGCSFQGRNLGNALEILTKMIQNNNCFKVLTLAGAMIPAGMGEIICQLIERHVVNAIITTGANISHALVNCFDPSNQSHYIGSSIVNDDELYKRRINRIYDTFLPEKNFINFEEVFTKFLTKCFKSGKEYTLTPCSFLLKIGKELSQRNFIKVASKYNIPIFCGATSDSELGLTLMKCRKKNNIKIILDEIGDIDVFSEKIQIYHNSGTIIIGGGVPRNWAQQVYPYLDQLNEKKSKKNNYEGYNYSVRIHTAVPYDGGLSGCTTSESISWGKYSKNALHQSIWGDATIIFPLLITALFQRMDRLSIKIQTNF